MWEKSQFCIKGMGDGKPTHKEKGVNRSSSKYLAEKLKRLMREYPTAKQGEYAE